MMHTLVGREGFARGMTLYFQRHDGHAVTCEDFAQAIAAANPGSTLDSHLDLFKRWYSQAGTPRLSARGIYDAAAGTYTLSLSQSNPPSPGQPVKLPNLIPVAMGLVGRDGRALPLQLQGEPVPAGTERVLVLTESQQSWVFTGLDQEPVPSLLRGFSAPVILDDGLSDADRLTLLAHDADPFNRWEAAQRLGLARIVAALDAGAAATLDEAFVEAMRGVLRDETLDPAFKELALTLPTEGYVAEQVNPVDPQRIHAVREALVDELARKLQGDWTWAYESHQIRAGYRPDAEQSGKRALANLALAMLVRQAVHAGDTVWPGRAYQRFKDASNMTDRLGALEALLYSYSDLAGPALERFHAQFRHDPLVLDKWFMLQARAPEREGRVFAKVKQLMKHPDFTLGNPNRARALMFSLTLSNPAAFHRADAAGYVFWAEKVVELDAMNPQLASRFARSLDRWRALAEPYRSAAREAIARVATRSDLSPDTAEIVNHALQD